MGLSNKGIQKHFLTAYKSQWKQLKTSKLVCKGYSRIVDLLYCGRQYKQGIQGQTKTMKTNKGIYFLQI